jgi:hypothetical protein
MDDSRSLGQTVRDVRLLRRVGALFDEIDPVPDSVLEAARAALEWRDFDARVARLIEDEAYSGDFAGVRAGVRATGEHRLLTFEGPGLTVAVEAVEISGSRRLVGQLVPAGPDSVTLEAAGRSGHPLQARVDHLGRFSLGGVPAGLVRLRCMLPDGTQVVTEWLET